MTVAGPGHTLATNQVLRVGEMLRAPDGGHVAILRRDGSLAVHAGPAPHGSPLWTSPAAPEPGAYFAAMQEDGNLVVRRGAGPTDARDIIWASQEAPRAKGGHVAKLWNDGSLGTYLAGKCTWSSVPAPATWFETLPHAALHDGANWSALIRRDAQTTPEAARRIAEADHRIGCFFYCRQPMRLPRNGGFAPGDALYFAGEPWVAAAPQCELHKKYAP